MFEREEDDHPLYPKEGQTYRKIQLYPPRECESCAKTGHDVEWYELTKTETTAMWIAPGTTFTIKTELKKLCKRCHMLEINHSSLYGAFG